MQKLQKENENLKEENQKSTSKCSLLEDECRSLKEECEQLKASPTQSTYLAEESLQNDNAKVKYYTGLPNFEALMALFSYVNSSIQSNSRHALTCFQQFILVLVKLKLNPGDQDLAFRFGVNQSTVSRYFKKWIDVIYIRLCPLVKCPDRGELLQTMPMEFQKRYGKCVIIIDCFEVFMERPTNLTAHAQIWSNYKHHNTAKFLIGISPQGAITFISKGWGGRVSDVFLTEHCGLEKLSPGNLILADRGFNIHDSADLFCAEVKLPPFTRGKKQLSQADVDIAHQLSRV
jgi:hypothetical protein